MKVFIFSLSFKVFSIVIFMTNQSMINLPATYRCPPSIPTKINYLKTSEIKIHSTLIEFHTHHQATSFTKPKMLPKNYRFHYGLRTLATVRPSDHQSSPITQNRNPAGMSWHNTVPKVQLQKALRFFFSRIPFQYCYQRQVDC